MRLLPPSLLYLMRLQWTGRIRRIGRRLKTWKGALSLLVILLLFGFWTFSIYLSTKTSTGQYRFGETGYTTGMSAILLINLLFSRWDQGLGFRPHEIAFLFPGPFSRRELLAYRMLRDAGPIIVIAIPVSFFFGSFAGTWIGAFLGAFLSLCCINLVQMLIGIVGATVAESMIARGRRYLSIVILVLVAGSVAFSGYLNSSNLKDLSQTPFLQIIRTPFIPFARVISSTQYFPDMIGWLAVSVGIVSGLVFCILRLESNFNEAAIAASQRTMKRIEQLRRGQFGWSTTDRKSVSLGVPRLPRLAGAGPIIWHQLTGALRSFKRTSFFLVIMLLAMTWPFFTLMRNESFEQLLPSLLPMAVMFMAIMLPQYLRYDFRGDVERMELLKTLPIRAIPLVFGELAVPILLLTLLQALICGGLAVAGIVPLVTLLTILAFCLPVNALIFGVENLLFLLYPMPAPTSGAAGIENLPKQLLYTMIKLLLISLVVGVSAGVGALVWFLFEKSLAAGLIAAWLTAMGAVVLQFFSVVGAFLKFDPSQDMPA